MVEYVGQKMGQPLSIAASKAGANGSVLRLSGAFLFTAFALPEKYPDEFQCVRKCVRSGRREPHGSRPPTPPDVRFRIRRFVKLLPR